MNSRSAAFVPARRSLAVALAFGTLPLAVYAPAFAAITGSAQATGTYRGEIVRSGKAELSLEVAPASPALALQLDGGYDDGDGTPGKSVGDGVDYIISVSNAGDVGIDGVAVTLTLDQSGEALPVAAPPQIVDGDAVNPGVLDRGETWEFAARYPVEFANLERDGPIVAMAAVSGLGTGRPVDAQSRAAVALPPLQDIEPHLVSLSHVPDRTEVRSGEQVEFTLAISNRSDRILSARLTGSADEGIELLDGEGARLDFGVVQVAAAGSATLRYAGRVSGTGVNRYLSNEAAITDPATGLPLIPPARAVLQGGTVLRRDCNGIAIRVFEDENRDGQAGESEAGIAGVRVRAEGGSPLTTDPSGNFFSPCETVSRLAGIELRFDLDEDTLPEGYYVTTRDPYAVRVERGETAEVAFGAAEARVVRIDLNAAAFGRNSVTPDAEMTEGLTRLVSVLGREPSILRLTYFAHSEASGLAEQRLEAVRRTILDYWQASDAGYDLKIDARIVLSDG